jgi:hypothetical protein
MLASQKDIKVSGLQLSISVVMMLIAIAGTTMTLIDRWASVSDRLLTQEVKSEARWEAQAMRDERQDQELLRINQQLNTKLDNVTSQLKFLTDHLITTGGPRG